MVASWLTDLNDISCCLVNFFFALRKKFEKYKAQVKSQVIASNIKSQVYLDFVKICDLSLTSSQVRVMWPTHKMSRQRSGKHCANG